jgi:hypothetical protein
MMFFCQCPDAHNMYLLGVRYLLQVYFPGQHPRNKFSNTKFVAETLNMCHHCLFKCIFIPWVYSMYRHMYVDHLESNSDLILLTLFNSLPGAGTMDFPPMIVPCGFALWALLPGHHHTRMP